MLVDEMFRLQSDSLVKHLINFSPFKIFIFLWTAIINTFLINTENNCAVFNLDATSYDVDYATHKKWQMRQAHCLQSSFISQSFHWHWLNHAKHFPPQYFSPSLVVFWYLSIQNCSSLSSHANFNSITRKLQWNREVETASGRKLKNNF